MKMQDVTGGKVKIGSTTYNMVEAKYNGVVVWPAGQPSTTTYVIRSVTVRYSSGTMLYASGSNYAYFIGSIQEYRNGQAYGNPFTDTLTPTSISGTYPRVTIVGDAVYGDDLGFTTYSQTTWTIGLSYQTATSSASVTQQANVKTEVSRTPTGSKTYDYSQTSIEYSNYQITFTSNKYSSISSAAPASGAETSALRATLSFSARHWEIESTPYVQDIAVEYTYTSRPGQTYEETIPDGYSGSETTRAEWAPDTLHSITGSATGFTRTNMTVSIASEGKTDYDTGLGYGRSATYYARVAKTDGSGTYATSDPLTLYQEINTHRSYDRVDSIDVTPTDSNYTVSLSVDDFDTIARAAEASGETTTLTASGSHRHTVTTVRTLTPITEWTSGEYTEGEQYEEEPTSTSTTVDDTPIVSTSDNWILISSGSFEILSEGTTPYDSGLGYGRRGTITATNGNASPASVYVYQKVNAPTYVEYGYDLAVSIDGNRTIPWDQGQIGVSYTCKERSRTHYTSDDATEWSSYERVTPTITTYISGQQTALNITSLTDNSFVVENGDNTVQSSRTITVEISRRTATPVSDTITQEAYVPSVQNVATFEPIMFSVNTGPYLRGKVYYLFTIDSGSLWQGTLTGVNFCYRVNNGSKQTVQIGTFSVSETSQPTALEPSGVTIPTFSSGTVKAWFEVTGSKGGFDTINAGEDYSITITF